MSRDLRRRLYGLALAVLGVCVLLGPGEAMAWLVYPEPFIGEIRMFAGNFAPYGWAFCSGDLIPIRENETLFALIGFTYGGIEGEAFALPDLRGRIAVGMGEGEGLTSRILGGMGGVEWVSLAPHQASHTHAVAAKAHPGQGDSAGPDGAVWARTGDGALDYSTAGWDTFMAWGAVQIDPAGGGAGHENMPPYLPVNFIIALDGVEPKRD